MLNPLPVGNNKQLTVINEILSLIEKDVRSWHDVELASFFQRIIGIFVKQFNIPTIDEVSSKAIQQEVERFLGPNSKPFYYVKSSSISKATSRQRRIDQGISPPAKRQRTQVLRLQAVPISDDTSEKTVERDTSSSPHKSIQHGYLSGTPNSAFNYGKGNPPCHPPSVNAETSSDSIPALMRNNSPSSQTSNFYGPALSPCQEISGGV